MHAHNVFNVGIIISAFAIQFGLYIYIHPYRTFIEGTFDRIQAQISHFQFENNRGINLHIQKKKI